MDGFSFAGLMRADGLPVNDLNDFAHVHPDQWEAEREAIEEAFSFAAGSPQQGDSGVGDIPRSGTRLRGEMGAREKYVYE